MKKTSFNCMKGYLKLRLQSASAFSKIFMCIFSQINQFFDYFFLNYAFFLNLDVAVTNSLGSYRDIQGQRKSQIFFSKLKFFPILRLNPADCSYNSQSLRLEIKVVTKDIVSFQQGLKSDKCTCTIKVFNVYWSSV